VYRNATELLSEGFAKKSKNDHRKKIFSQFAKMLAGRPNQFGLRPLTAVKLPVAAGSREVWPGVFAMSHETARGLPASPFSPWFLACL
jgi:hypothetical protein